MSPKLGASLFAGRNLFILILIITGVNCLFNGNFSFKEVWILGVNAFLYGWLGFVFSGLLISPLERYFRRSSETESFVVFLLVGASVPAVLWALIEYYFGNVLREGQDSNNHTVFWLAALGAIASASAWWFLKNWGAGKKND